MLYGAIHLCKSLWFLGQGKLRGTGCQIWALGLLALGGIPPGCMTAPSAHAACRLIGGVVQSCTCLLVVQKFTALAMAETPACHACAATNHMVRADKLRRAHRVAKEQNRLARGGGTQGVGDNGEDIIDV